MEPCQETLPKNFAYPFIDCPSQEKYNAQSPNEINRRNNKVGVMQMNVKALPPGQKRENNQKNCRHQKQVERLMYNLGF